MISEYNGDIFLAPVNVIVQQCNCFCVMGAGFARTISRTFPLVADMDRLTAVGDPKKLGKFNFARVSLAHNPCLRAVCNLYGQFKYGSDGRFTSYDALDMGFRAIEEDCTAFKGELNSLLEKPPILAIPYKLGCKLGGGSWPVVYAILKDIFDNSRVSLVICKV